MQRLAPPVWLFVLVSQATGVAFAGELPAAVSISSWGRAAGLPQSTVTGIAPASDGSLWVTTFGGLARFDGERAVAEEPGPGTLGKVSRLTAVAVDPQRTDRLFLGTESYGVWIFDRGVYAQPRQPLALQATGVHSIEVVRERVIVASRAGVFQRDADGVWTVLSTRPTNQVAHVAGRGSWLCAGAGLFWLDAAPGAVEESVLSDRRCSGGLADGQGNFWFLSGETVWLATPGEAPRALAGLRLEFGFNQEPFIDGDEVLWVPDGGGVRRLGTVAEVREAIDTGEVREGTLHAVGPPVSWYAAPTGELWVGALAEGLARLTPMGFARLPSFGDHTPRGTGPLHASGSRLWFASACSDLRTRVAGEEGHLVAELSDVCIDRLWGGNDEAYLSSGGEVFVATPDSLVSLGEVWEHGAIAQVSALEGREGKGAWVGTHAGGVFWVSKTGVERLDPQPPVGVGAIQDLLVRRDGSLAVGHEHGLCLLEESGWQCLTVEDGIAAGTIRHLAEDAEGRLWHVSYGQGLGWTDADGSGTVPTGSRGIPDRFLSSVFFSEAGDAWLQGNAGVTRVRADDLIAARDGRPIRPSRIAVGEASGNLRHSAALLDNGQLWTAGVDAITVVDTREPLPTELPVAPHIARAAMGDVELDPSGTVVPSSAFRRLEVDYSLPTTSARNPIWFEHRLVRSGVLGEWVAADRSGRAVYPRLTPGDYSFEVRGVTQDGRRGATGRLRFSIQPRLRERWEVLIGGLSVVIAVLLMAFLRSVRQNRRLQEEVIRRKAAQALLRERESRQQVLRLKLEKAKRLEALGRFTGGVAHDLNNILTAVVSSVELIDELADPDDADLVSCVRTLHASVDRGSDLVAQLLSHRSQELLPLRFLDPAAVVADLEPTLSALQPDGLTFTLTLRPCGSVLMNRSQLEQVVCNLVVNAFDAVSSEGVVNLSLGSGDDDTVVVVVRDDGPGIPAHLRAHIFEPFFTTKGSANGTGLGLPTVKAIVEEAGGRLRLTTGGGGTTFEVELPCSTAPKASCV